MHAITASRMRVRSVHANSQKKPTAGNPTSQEKKTKDRSGTGEKKLQGPSKKKRESFTKDSSKRTSGFAVALSNAPKSFTLILKDAPFPTSLIQLNQFEMQSISHTFLSIPKEKVASHHSICLTAATNGNLLATGSFEQLQCESEHFVGMNSFLEFLAKGWSAREIVPIWGEIGKSIPCLL